MKISVRSAVSVRYLCSVHIIGIRRQSIQTHSFVGVSAALTHAWVVSAWRCRCTIKHAIICFVLFHSFIHLGLAQNKHISTIFIWFVIHFICSFIAFYDYVLWLLCICLRAIAFDNASSDTHHFDDEDHGFKFSNLENGKAFDTCNESFETSRWRSKECRIPDSLYPWLLNKNKHFKWHSLVSSHKVYSCGANKCRQRGNNNIKKHKIRIQWADRRAVECRIR